MICQELAIPYVVVLTTSRRFMGRKKGGLFTQFRGQMPWQNATLVAKKGDGARPSQAIKNVPYYGIAYLTPQQCKQVPAAWL
jgi:hypothetical protein